MLSRHVFLTSVWPGFCYGAALNINSLLAHLDDLKFFVLDSKIYVLAINETKIDS